MKLTGMGRFVGPRFPPLEQLKGQLYTLCKDQHGCRYLQKRLEENSEANVNMIFDESFDHMAELMSGACAVSGHPVLYVASDGHLLCAVDPFGNYLCQKLFGYCTEEQKTLIARKVASGLVAVSLNMHGTRSVQKLIDCLGTSEQVRGGRQNVSRRSSRLTPDCVCVCV
jgi:hypothetical protein